MDWGIGWEQRKYRSDRGIGLQKKSRPVRQTLCGVGDQISDSPLYHMGSQGRHNDGHGDQILKVCVREWKQNTNSQRLVNVSNWVLCGTIVHKVFSREEGVWVCD